jgi:hypothetical protein
MNLYIYESARKDKRFLAVFVQNDLIKFRINFGSSTGSTFIDHGDIIKRSNYLKRHAALNEDWETPTTAASLSRWLLWNTDNLETNNELFSKTS